jgi:hypothetical protein
MFVFALTLASIDPFSSLSSLNAGTRKNVPAVREALAIQLYEYDFMERCG